MTFSSFKSAIPWSFDSDSESETLKAEISRPNPSPIPSLQPRVSEFRVRDERLGKFCVVSWPLRATLRVSVFFWPIDAIPFMHCTQRKGKILLWQFEDKQLDKCKMFAMQIATMVEKVHTKALNSSHLLHKNQWHRHAQNAIMHQKKCTFWVYNKPFWFLFICVFAIWQYSLYSIINWECKI